MTPIDALGHPIEVGCTVLTTKHYSHVMDTLTVVKKVNKKSIVLEITKYHWDFSTSKYITTKGAKVYRQPHQMIVVDKQLEYNRNEYPECAL